jgi:hypothetical protein
MTAKQADPRTALAEAWQEHIDHRAGQLVPDSLIEASTCIVGHLAERGVLLVTEPMLVDALSRYFIEQNMGMPGPRQDRMGAAIFAALSERQESADSLKAASEVEGPGEDYEWEPIGEPSSVAPDPLRQGTAYPARRVTVKPAATQEE